MRTLTPTLRAVLLGGVVGLALLRLSSCSPSPEDPWQEKAAQLLAGRGPFHQRDAALRRERDSLLALRALELAKAARAHRDDSLAVMALARALTGKDSLSACRKGWDACKLEVQALANGIGYDNLVQAIEGRRADGAVARVDTAERVVADRPAPRSQPRRLLLGLTADAIVLAGVQANQAGVKPGVCGAGLVGVGLEASRRLWIFEARGRAAAGYGAAQCNGALTSGPGLHLGGILGF